MDNKVLTNQTKFEEIKALKSFKGMTDHNPLMVQRFGADPYALVYDGRVYIYMTGDSFTYGEDGAVTENTYSNIDTINVISSDDLVNWTDHGTVYASGEKGASKWGRNSWAPAAAYKNIDGKDKFFLYFANNGNGIAVLSADSPVGPFTDPIDKPLISRATPTCAEVTWLFDPAVLMDDDGRAYIYFGGGVPSLEAASNPGTARVCELGDDMISLKGTPRPIENVSYLFEDSGINKIDGTYYYSYCTNFSVTPEASKEHGFDNGEIMTMKSDSPMGPFTACNPVLKNPEFFFGVGGNNHHCMFEFEGQWYIAYHSRILEEKMGILHGYRSTSIDKLVLNEKNEPSKSTGTREGVAQLKSVVPYSENKAVTFANAAGVDTTQYGENAVACGSGDMILTAMKEGSWIKISGVDFGAEGSDSLELSVIGKGQGAVKICTDTPDSKALGFADIADAKEGVLSTVSAKLETKITGEHDLFFVFSGDEFELYSWKFNK
jgi:arabinoxylan arabinofuranohydrolase